MSKQFPVQWQEHIGLLITLVVGFLTIFNLLYAADWHIPTALSILQISGTTTILLGTMISLTTTLVGVLFWVAIGYIAYYPAREKRCPSIRAICGVGIVIIVALVALPVWQLLSGLLAIAAGVFFGVNDRKEPITGSNSNKRFIAAVVAGPLSLLVFGGQMWMPRENLDFDNANWNGTAFVLESSPDETIILKDRPRRVVYIRDSQLVGREICEPRRSRWYSTLPQMTSQPRPEPPCSRS